MNIVAGLCVLLAGSVAANQIEFERATFVTKLDHYSPQDNRTVEFEYTYRLDYHRPGAPLFVFINDANSFTLQWLESGLIHDLARELNGGLFTAEHRFFGKNFPTNNTSFENLQYLTVEQSLADIAELLTTIRAQLNEATPAPIILWGSGYGATLATWAKQRYPHLITGVLSSSGIYRRQTHSHEQYDAVSQVIRNIGGSQCATNVQTVFESIEVMLREHQLEQVAKDFHLCDVVQPTNQNDMGMLFRKLIKTIIDHINQFHLSGLRNFCNALNAIEGDQYGSFVSWVSSLNSGHVCYDPSYTRFVSALQDETQNSARVNMYYECTQLGNFPTSVNGDSLFGRVYAFFGCSNIFGRNYSWRQLRDAVERLNVQFGGKTPNVNNVIYTNGMLDADVPFGITDLIANGFNAFNLAYSGKSEDLLSVNDQDFLSVAMTKQFILRTIRIWVGATAL